MKRTRGLLLAFMLVGGCGSSDPAASGVDASAGAGGERGLVDAAMVPPDGGAAMPEGGAAGSDGSRPDAMPGPDAAVDAGDDAGADVDEDEDDDEVDSGPIDDDPDAGDPLPTDCASAGIEEAVIRARTLPELVVDDVLLDTAGVVYVYSSGTDELHRWSAVTESALGTIALGPDSTHVAYSAANDRIYVVYADGAVRQIDLESSSSRTSWSCRAIRTVWSLRARS